MSKETIRCTENHIYCDACDADSADAVGYSIVKMRVLEKELRGLGWHIRRNEHYCQNCKPARKG